MKIRVITIFIALFFIAIGLVRGERIKWEFFPEVEAEIISAKVKMEYVLAFAICMTPLPLPEINPCRVTMSNFGEEIITVDIYKDFSLSADEGQVLLSTAKDNNPPSSFVDLHSITLVPYETLVLCLECNEI